VGWVEESIKNRKRIGRKVIILMRALIVKVAMAGLKKVNGSQSVCGTRNLAALSECEGKASCDAAKGWRVQNNQNFGLRREKSMTGVTAKRRGVLRGS